MPNIMVVDDDRDIREALDVVLTDAGYNVTTAPSGLKLLTMLKFQEPDLIILDVMMSWIDGIGLCRALKSNKTYAHIPVIFISARVEKDDIARGMNVGAADYIPKPVDISELLTRVGRAIRTA